MKVPVDSNGQQVNSGSKLDERTLEGTFIGYLQGHGGYWVLLKDGRLIKSKDVEFLEGPAHRTESTSGINEDVDFLKSNNTSSQRTVPVPVTSVPPDLPTSVDNNQSSSTTNPPSNEDETRQNPRLNAELPKASDYWLPANTKQVPKPTEKV